MRACRCTIFPVGKYFEYAADEIVEKIWGQSI